MTQADVARAMSNAGLAGIHPQTVLKLEAGSRSLKFHEAIALARIFGVPAEKLTQAPELPRVDQMGRELLRELRGAGEFFDIAVTRLLMARANLEALLEHEDLSDLIRADAVAALAENDPDEVRRKNHIVQLYKAGKYPVVDVPPPDSDEPFPPPDDFDVADYLAQQELDRERGK